MRKWEKIALFIIAAYFLWIWATRVVILYRTQWHDPNLTVHLTIAITSIIAATILLFISVRHWKIK
jgi:hypothetical protein